VSIDIEKLKALAAVATPGPWQWWTSNSTLRLTGADGKDGGVLHAYVHSGYGDISCNEANRAFIEAANPAAVRELVSEIERLRAPSSATTAGERQSIGEAELNAAAHPQYDPQSFINGVKWAEGKLAARSAGDAVLCREAALEVAGTRLANWLFGLSVAQAMPDTWRKTCAELVASWNSVVRGAAPAPGNTAQPTAYDTMDHDQLSKLGQQQKGEHDGR
jgi:hypothetical protein